MPKAENSKPPRNGSSYASSKLSSRRPHADHVSEMTSNSSSPDHDRSASVGKQHNYLYEYSKAALFERYGQEVEVYEDVPDDDETDQEQQCFANWGETFGRPPPCNPIPYRLAVIPTANSGPTPAEVQASDAAMLKEILMARVVLLPKKEREDATEGVAK
ncbi:hypothetical protein BU16DRAFT_560235 [Lophium mytilinum]|uniref:Uncharacterized protein n=1 Tax=Lophium mytilinum TaxID=390894 RepID=A0A6A6QXR3_9PEZI|nr:hypothetical protein BU16DRAFT_560235 [Lophium mytilinum]